MTADFAFELRARDSATRARLGRITTPKGDVDTPAFMPVGTQAAVRCLRPDDVRRTGAQIILSNTYHLHLKPGEGIIAKAGGLHAFMGWDGPILTDSGGFQVFSLPKRRISEDGVSFTFEKDGNSASLSPESSVAIQLALDSDIIMAFDECVPFPAPRDQARRAMERTLRWAARSLEAFGSAKGKAIFGIVQGSTYDDLRAESALKTSAMGFNGIAIGGVSVGEGKDQMLSVVDVVAPLLPEAKPRYVMGVGTPDDIVEAVALGADMFDCVIPTRHARGGLLYTARGPIRIRHRRYRRDFYPVDRSCRCYACTRFTRAYMRHLFETGEVLGRILASIHNIAFYQDLMSRIRKAVESGTYGAFLSEFRRGYSPSEAEAGGDRDDRQEFRDTDRSGS